MSPQEHAEFLKKTTLKELVHSCLWQSIMEGTAHCGWTDRARDGLFESCWDHVQWAIDEKIGGKIGLSVSTTKKR